MHKLFILKHTLALIVLFNSLVINKCFAGFLPGINDDFFSVYDVRAEDRIYVEYVKTVLLHPENFEMGLPVYHVGSSESLLLQFDALTRDIQSFNVKVFLCNQFWNPYDLLDNEYLNGFNGVPVTDYQRSFNTAYPYVHYSFKFPNAEMNPLRSGNFLLVVMDTDTDIPILSRRMYVAENKGDVNLTTGPTVIVEDRQYRQEVKFSVETPVQIQSPYDNLSATVLQNLRPDNAYRGVPPSMVQGDAFSFDYNGKIVFDGTSEFRVLDTRSRTNPVQTVETIIRDEEGILVYNLTADALRRFRVYESSRDIDGSYVIRDERSNNHAIEADYVWVNFKLGVDGPSVLNGGNVYVLGEFCLWQPGHGNLMKYNSESKKYEVTMLMKQGYYNYMYGLGKEENGFNLGEIEGDHSETINTYTVFVYYSDPSLGTDRILMYRTALPTQQKF